MNDCRADTKEVDHLYSSNDGIRVFLVPKLLGFAGAKGMHRCRSVVGGEIYQGPSDSRFGYINEMLSTQYTELKITF